VVTGHFRVPAEHPGAKLLVDGHVHFHECFTWEAFLNGAARNFARARATLGLRSDSSGCLMFTESWGAKYFHVLAEGPTLARSCGWRAERGDDGRSVLLTHVGGASIVVIAGRQIVTAERLEVLALGCLHEFPDGKPVGDVVHAVADHEGVPVIPWGFGKWLGRRGRIVRDLIDRREVPFCLGDNGGRARSMQRPRLFDQAERASMPVLGGSDPLPLARHGERAGSYGFVLDAWQATSRPAPAITRRIQALKESPAAFGELSSAASMLRSQLGLQWKRHRMTRGARASADAASVAQGDGA
jgi:hypothetical protein